MRTVSPAPAALPKINKATEPFIPRVPYRIQLLFLEHRRIQQHRTWKLGAHEWLQLPRGQVMIFFVFFCIQGTFMGLEPAMFGAEIWKSVGIL